MGSMGRLKLVWEDKCKGDCRPQRVFKVQDECRMKDLQFLRVLIASGRCRCRI